MKNFDTEIVIQLEQKFKDQAVKSQDKSVRADIINDLQLLQSGFQHIQFGLFYRIFRLIIPDEHELLNIRGIFFYKIQWNLKNDSLVGDYTFGRIEGRKSWFEWSYDGKAYKKIGRIFDTTRFSDEYCKYGEFTGTMVGITCADRVLHKKCADFDFFEYIADESRMVE